MFRSLSVLMLVACGSKSIEHKPAPINELVSFSYKLDETDGDFLLRAGQMCFIGDNYYCNKVSNLQDKEGRIWRNQSKIGKEEINASSRDMLLGFLMYVQQTKDFKGLNNLTIYLKNHFYKLCPTDSDNRCYVTPSILNLFNIVQGKKSYINSYKIEASTAEKGYPLYLIALKLLVHKKANLWNVDLQDTAKILFVRQSCNPLYRYLAGYDVEFKEPVKSNDWLMQRSCEETTVYDSNSWAFLSGVMRK